MGYKYCVASVSQSCVETRVSYYAYIDNINYGLHLVDDWKDKNVIWYDTEEEALKHRYRPFDCVVTMHTDYIPKFSKETLKEFINGYKDFDFAKGKIIIVYDSIPYICTDTWRGTIEVFNDFYVKNWKNDENIIVITLSQE